MYNMIKSGLQGCSVLALAAFMTVGGSNEASACNADSPYMGSVCYMLGNYCPDGYMQANGQQLPVNTYPALYSIFGNFYGGTSGINFNLPDLRGRSLVSYGQGTGLPTYIQIGTYRGQESVGLNVSQVPLQSHTHAATFVGTGGGSASPAQASGSVSLPVAVTVPAQTVSVTGSVKLGSSTATGAAAISNNAVMTKAGGPQGAIYAASGTSADLNIGPSQTFSGSVPSQTVNTTAAGTVTLPVTGGGGGITGGTVTVSPNTPVPASQPVSTLAPQLAVTACIATTGIYPVRP